MNISYVEVLIAIFILAFGLFGIMGVYIHSFKDMENSYQRTLAISQVIEQHEIH
jgi:Tfp pilus assembly protein PilV